MKRRGKQKWPLYLTGDEISRLVECLDRLPYYVKIPTLTKVFGLSRSGVVVRFLRRHNILNVPEPIAWHPVRGHITRYATNYYDPNEVIYVLRGILNERGDDLFNLPLHGPEVREAPPVQPIPCFLTPVFARWSLEERHRRVLAAGSFGQWLQPKEVAEWLEVTVVTLCRWRRADVGPPYLQARDLVPSSWRNPDGTGRIQSIRTPRPSFNHRYDPVLYDKNRVIAWLKNNCVQRLRPVV